MPFGSSLVYGAGTSLSGNNYHFHGTGTVYLDGNNFQNDTTVEFEGVTVRLDQETSRLHNIRQLKIKDGASVIVNNKYLGGQFSNSEHTYVWLENGSLAITDFPTAAKTESIKQLYLFGGVNRISVVGDSISQYDYTLKIEKLGIAFNSSTLYFYIESGLANSTSSPNSRVQVYMPFHYPYHYFKGLIPFSVMRVIERGNGTTSDTLSFTHSNIWNGEKLSAVNSPVYNQSQWLDWDNALNVTVESPQSFSGNRIVHSLRLTNNGNIDLENGTLWVHSGAFLFAPDGVSELFLNGGVLRSGNLSPVYYFHTHYDYKATGSFPVGGYNLWVNSDISESSINNTPVSLVKSGPATLIFGGSIGNSYRGTTYVQEGRLALNKTPPATAVRNVVVNQAASLYIMQSKQIAPSSTVTLQGTAKSKAIGRAASLILAEGVEEQFHTLKITGESTLTFERVGVGGAATSLVVRRLLIDTDDDFLTIYNWHEYFDYLLVSRAFTPGSAVLSRIHFDGWDPGAELRDYDMDYWEIVPQGAPEPVLYGAIVGTVGLIVWRVRRRHARESAGPKVPAGLAA